MQRIPGLRSKGNAFNYVAVTGGTRINFQDGGTKVDPSTYKGDMKRVKLTINNIVNSPGARVAVYVIEKGKPAEHKEISNYDVTKLGLPKAICYFMADHLLEIIVRYRANDVMPVEIKLNPQSLHFDDPTGGTIFEADVQVDLQSHYKPHIYNRLTPEELDIIQQGKLTIK